MYAELKLSGNAQE